MLIVFFRALILYSVIFIVIRLMGKKEMSKVQPFELAIIIVISDLASAPMSSRGLSLFDGIVPIITLLITYMIFLLLNYHNNKMQDFVCGKPLLIIKEGKLIEKEFQSQKYTVGDIMSQLHEKQVFSISDVKYAIIETNGNLSVITYEDNIENLPLNVIEDGKYALNNMELLNIKEAEIERILKAKKLKLEDVLVGHMDKNYKFIYQLKEVQK